MTEVYIFIRRHFNSLTPGDSWALFFISSVGVFTIQLRVSKNHKLIIQDSDGIGTTILYYLTNC